MVDIEHVGVGKICNNNCIMCTSLLPVPKGYEPPSTEELMSMVDLTKNHDYFSITGGEPTLRKDLFLLLEYANRRYPNKRISLITNGRLCFYEPFVKKLAKIKNIVIKTELHADNEKEHDAITRCDGSFRQTFAGIKNLLKNGLEVEFRIVISKINYKNVPGIAEMIAREFKDVSRVVIFPIDIIGNAFKNRSSVLVTYSEIRPFVEDTVRRLSRQGIDVKLFHTPYCVIGKEFHRFIFQGITVAERRVDFAEICSDCRFKTYCPRVWKSYAKIVGTQEFKAIR